MVIKIKNKHYSLVKLKKNEKCSYCLAHKMKNILFFCRSLEATFGKCNAPFKEKLDLYKERRF